MQKNIKSWQNPYNTVYPTSVWYLKLIKISRYFKGVFIAEQKEYKGVAMGSNKGYFEAYAKKSGLLAELVFDTVVKETSNLEV